MKNFILGGLISSLLLYSIGSSYLLIKGVKYV